jgi:hypothetical protein
MVGAERAGGSCVVAALSLRRRPRHYAGIDISRLDDNG